MVQHGNACQERWLVRCLLPAGRQRVDRDLCGRIAVVVRIARMRSRIMPRISARYGLIGNRAAEQALRVLLIEDDRTLGEAVHDHVAASGHAVDWTKTIDDAAGA